MMDWKVEAEGSKDITTRRVSKKPGWEFICDYLKSILSRWRSTTIPDDIQAVLTSDLKVYRSSKDKNRDQDSELVTSNHVLHYLFHAVKNGVHNKTLDTSNATIGGDLALIFLLY